MAAQGDLCRGNIVQQQNIPNPIAHRHDVVHLGHQSVKHRVAQHDQFAHAQRRPHAAVEICIAETAPCRGRDRTDCIGYRAVQAKPVQRAAGATAHIQFAITKGRAPAHQRAPLTAHRRCVIREHHRQAALLGGADKTHRDALREGVKMNEVRFLFIEDLLEPGRGMRITFAIKLAKIGFR